MSKTGSVHDPGAAKVLGERIGGSFESVMGPVKLAVAGQVPGFYRGFRSREFSLDVYDAR